MELPSMQRGAEENTEAMIEDKTEERVEERTDEGTERILVEVSVQDAYFEQPEDERLEDRKSAEFSQEAIAASAAPIAASTWEQWFSRWLDYLQTDLPPRFAYELSLRLTNNAEIQALNAQYRQKDQPTDVLAFAALEIDYPQSAEMQAAMPLYLGDIIISVETAAIQAQERGHSLAYELSWLAAHGLLHLLGWDHPDEASLQAMLDQQDALLQGVGILPDWQGETQKKDR